MTRRRRTLPASAAALAAALALASGAAAQTADARRALAVPAAERDAVLAEMRQMLASVGAVVQGLASGDRAAVEQGARASGTTVAVDPHLREILPPEFLRLGMQTHRGFDDLADAARAGAPTEDVLKRLGGITAQCVACHAAYRFEAR